MSISANTGIEKSTTMIGIKVFEMTPNGLQEVVELPTVKPLTDEKEQQEAIDGLIEMAYNNDKMYLSMNTLGFAIQGLKNKTIVVKGIFKDD